MTRSDQIGQLAAALALAQAKFRAIGKDKTARIASQKGTFSYTYADLATVVDATRLALAEQGLSVMQPVRMGDGQITVTSVLAHKSGEWLAEEMSWPVASADNRSIGSGITYARRHAYLALVGGAATDEDDDAEQARGGDHDTQRPQPRPPQHQAAAPANGSVDNARVVRIKRIFDEAKAKGLVMQDHQEELVKVALGSVKKSGQWTPEDMAFIEGVLHDAAKVKHIVESCDIKH